MKSLEDILPKYYNWDSFDYAPDLSCSLCGKSMKEGTYLYKTKYLLIYDSSR